MIAVAIGANIVAAAPGTVPAREAAPGERCRSDLDGQIAVSFALGIGYLEATVFGVLLILGGGIYVHSTTLLPGTGSERRVRRSSRPSRRMPTGRVSVAARTV
jgi:hypothetical protein